MTVARTGCAILLSVVASLATARGETLRDLTSAQFVANVPFDVQLSAAKDLGLHRARVGIRIYEVEKPGGKYDWSATDKRIRGLMAAGMTPIVTLFGRSRLVDRASPSEDGRVALSDAEIQAFSAFAAQVVQRYGTTHAGRKIIYEIWNEPNTKTFWGSPPDPEAYARLAEAACRTVRERTPSATLVGLAMEGTPLNNPYYVRSYGMDIYREWAARAATQPLMKCLDGISLHPYRREPETYLTENPALLNFMSERGHGGDHPFIVNSEWGYSVGAKNASTVDEQAALDVRLLLVGAGSKRVTNLYQLVNGGHDTGDVRQMYGLFELNGAPKPAGTAIKQLLGLIGAYDIAGVGMSQDLPGVFRFKASGEEGRKQEAQVLWRADGETTVPLDQVGPGRPVLIRDLVANRDVPIEGSTIKITASPLLLMFDKTSR